MPRKIAPAAVIAVAAAILLVLSWRSAVVVVPGGSGTLGDAKAALRRSGLTWTVSDEANGARIPLDADVVVDMSPSAGAFTVRFLPVRLTVAPAAQSVDMPDLEGMWCSDAQTALSETGLRADDRWFAYNTMAVVVSQTPRPGVVVAYGSTVRVDAPEIHGISETDPRFMDVHGLFYLRYGADDTGQCAICHTFNTCTNDACHAGSEALMRIRQPVDEFVPWPVP